MGNFFKATASPKKQKREQPRDDELSQVDHAKLEIRRTRTKLRKYQKQIEKETEQLNTKIKKLIKAGKKSQAKAILRLRKLRETALERTDSQILKLEQMISTIAQSEFNAEMVQSIETGNTALESLHKIMSLDYVEDVMEQADEFQAMNDEISDLIAGSGYAVDEDDVAADLATLEKEVNGIGNIDSDSVEQAMNLPVAPNHELVEDSEVSEEDAVEEGRTLVAAS
jgi:hypothetical protein